MLGSTQFGDFHVLHFAPGYGPGGAEFVGFPTKTAIDASPHNVWPIWCIFSKETTEYLRRKMRGRPRANQLEARLEVAESDGYG